MLNARTILCVGIASLGLSACGGGDDRGNADQNIAIDDGLPTGQIPPNAEVETLPADESSVTPSDELQNGVAAPEANEGEQNAE